MYLAHEVRLDRLVAIKLLPPELAAHAPLRERFLREARTAASLSHPHIVPIHAVDEIDQFVFFAMAYVDGESLSERIRQRGPLRPDDAARVLREIAWALGYAHERGVVHRDVKPENILLERGTGRALVADFGIARLVHTSGGSGVSEVMGTPEFMSPEQASGRAADARSDLYSLGVVGYYMLAGRLPFEASGAAALAQHITQAAPSLADVAPGVPRKLGHVIGRCLAKDPAERFAGGDALADAVGVAVAQRREPPTALRVFLAESESRSGLKLFPAFLLPGIGVWTILELTLVPLFLPEPPAARLLLDLVRMGVLVGAGLVPLGVTLARLRRVIAAGHERRELLDVIEADTQRRREDWLASGRRPSVPHVVKYWLWLGSLGVFGVLGALGLLGFEPSNPALYGALLATSGSAALIAAGAGWRARVLSGARLRFWAGPIGRLLYGLAGLGVGARRAPPEAVHRPTEIGVALAAQALFEGLPATTRDALRDLPEVVRRLQADAQEIRRHMEDLGEFLDLAAGGPTAAALVVRRHRLGADLRAAHDAAHRRLGQAVAALETIRLDLLR
ncbi:MAG: serine/threonine-protein kinase, partial [Gemmatimonadales bacterium]